MADTTFLPDIIKLSINKINLVRRYSSKLLQVISQLEIQAKMLPEHLSVTYPYIPHPALCHIIILDNTISEVRKNISNQKFG